MCSIISTVLGTFDVQTVEIKPQNDGKEFTDITCHFALGSLVKACRIVISVKASEMDQKISVKASELDTKMNDYCEYTATREEGSTEGTISVVLPRGEYAIVTYDDEDIDIESPAHYSTIIISSSSMIQPSGIYIPLSPGSLLHRIESGDEANSNNYAL